MLWRGEWTLVTAMGARLAAWREARGLSLDQVAARAGLSSAWLAELEAGREWVDRRRGLAALCAATSLEAATLTGQPYPPADPEHASVHAAAFQLRRVVMDPLVAAAGPSLDELAPQVAAAHAAEAAGDEVALAQLVPTLLREVDAASAVGDWPTADRDRADEFRAHTHAVAAGLARRLGYPDLAWSLLHAAGGRRPQATVAEEVRLLLDLGMPEHALARAQRGESADVELSCLAALVHAVAGRPRKAARVLDAAEGAADLVGARAAIGASRVAVLVEAGEWGAALDAGRQVDQEALTPARQTPLLIALATAAARHGVREAAALALDTAEALAPWLARLDPFARELRAILSDHPDAPAR